MSATRVLLGALLVIVVIAVLGGGCVLQGYNRAITMNEEVDGAWAQVENQLQRRYELIPNLVETVKGVAKQEREVFLGIAEARKAYFQAQTVPEKAEAASGVERALSRLLMLTETYPQLKSNESFMKLQDQLEGTENRLAVERQRYNDRVKELNQMVRRLPDRFYASLAGVGPAEYFESAAEAATAPRVNFSDSDQPKVDFSTPEAPKETPQEPVEEPATETPAETPE